MSNIFEYKSAIASCAFPFHPIMNYAILSRTSYNLTLDSTLCLDFSMNAYCFQIKEQKFLLPAELQTHA